MKPDGWDSNPETELSKLHGLIALRPFPRVVKDTRAVSRVGLDFAQERHEFTRNRNGATMSGLRAFDALHPAVVGLVHGDRVIFPVHIAPL